MATKLTHGSIGRAAHRGGGERAMPLGGAPRTTNYGSWIQGVNAQAQTSAARDKGRPIPSASPQNMASLIYATQQGLTPVSVATYGRAGYPRSAPWKRLGPIPKLSVGSGQTGASAARGLGYSPAGYIGVYPGVQTGSMSHMPYYQESVDVMQVNGGVPPIRGVAATDGNATLAPTYQLKPAHDTAFIARFIKQGRSPGAWEETSFGPLPRPLQAVQLVRRYSFAQGVGPVLARPLSPNVYFLGTQTTPDVYAAIGAGAAGVHPLGY